jgi:SAM-dependent methyltransferase
VAYSLRRSRPAIEWGLTQLAGIGVGEKRALDIGSGIGGASLYLKEHGWDTVGVEPDPNLAQVGRDRFGLDIRTGTLSDESSAELGTFTLAFSSHVWEHLPDPVATSSAVARCLRPGGHFLLVVPTFRRSRTLSWHAFKTPHTFMYTEVSLGNVLRAAGFEIEAHVFSFGADSELWVLARVPGHDAPRPAVERESAARVQRELATVPLRLPLGLPRRATTHLRTLRKDPRDFARRVRRWVSVRLGRRRS